MCNKPVGGREGNCSCHQHDLLHVCVTCPTRDFYYSKENIGQSVEQPHLVEGVPSHGRGMECDGL